MPDTLQRPFAASRATFDWLVSNARSPDSKAGSPHYAMQAVRKLPRPADARDRRDAKPSLILHQVCLSLLAAPDGDHTVERPEAVAEAERLLKARTDVLGRDHPDTLDTAFRLANWLQAGAAGPGEAPEVGSNLMQYTSEVA